MHRDRRDGHRRRHRFLQGRKDRFRRRRAGAAAGRRHRRPAGGSRDRRLRPDRRRRCARGLEGLHQGFLRPPRDPDRSLSPLRRRRRGDELCRHAAPADRRQGRRARRGQGRHHRAQYCRGECRDRRGAGRPAVRRRRRRARHRGVPRRRGGELLRPCRRQIRAAARLGARPQAGRRRRHRPQHRRHGGLFAGPLLDAGDRRRSDGADHPPDNRRHGGGRPALQGDPLRRADADQARR
jgi:hypothetical protein